MQIVQMSGFSGLYSKCDIAAAVVAERPFRRRVGEANDLSDDDQMIAGFDTVMKFAIEPRGGIGKYRAPCGAGYPWHACKLVG
jgi:hypothetical protein